MGTDLSSAEYAFLLYTLGNICADAVVGDADAFEALADPFWAGVITGLDRGMMDYGVFIARIVRLKDEYRKRGRPKGGAYASAVRAMRSAASIPDSEGGAAKRLYRRRGDVQGLLAVG